MTDAASSQSIFSSLPATRLRIALRDKPTARYVLDRDAMELIYPPGIQEQIHKRVRMVGDPLTAEQVNKDPSLLSESRMIFSGWGAAVLTPELLRAAQKLEVVFYGAGDTRSFYTDAARQHGVEVTSSNAANAVPVAEYTIAQIVMCLKRIWQHSFHLKTTRQWSRCDVGATGYGSTVGVVSLGDIGRRVVEKLSQMDVKVLAYDIQHDSALERKYRYKYASLETIFSHCDVVSLHTPLMAQTRGMVGGDLLKTMKPGASLINTSRGGIINQIEFIDTFRQRADLFAVLDVTDPEPPQEDCPLWNMANVIMTPHIAGSLGNECQRMGQWVVDDLDRYLLGVPMRGKVR